VTTHRPLEIDSFDELLREEPVILKRIAEFPGGGHLFLIHPFRMLADIGVKLAPGLQSELVRRFPELSGLSDTPYDALKSAGTRQNVNFRVHGLFRRKSR
jgi:hypothetical protein